MRQQMCLQVRNPVCLVMTHVTSLKKDVSTYVLNYKDNLKEPTCCFITKKRVTRSL